MWWWYYVIRSKNNFNKIIQAQRHYTHSEVDGKNNFYKIIQAQRHCTHLEVDGQILYNLYDDAHVKVSFNLKCYAIYCIFYFDSELI